MRALTRAWRAERLATRRTRIASTEPSFVLGMLFARPLSAARAASTASRGSDFPERRRSARFGRSTSMTLDAVAEEKARQPGSIRTGPFDTDLSDFAEALEPGEQRLVAGGVDCERLRAEEATDWVQSCRDMDVEVGVDPTSHSRRF